MLAWIILAVYLIGWAGFSVTITRLFERGTPSESRADRMVTVLVGMAGALMWPLVIPGAWVYKQVFANRGGSDG